MKKWDYRLYRYKKENLKIIANGWIKEAALL